MAMIRLRTLRRRMSLVLVLSLLLAQWATAGYLCPRTLPNADAAAMAEMPDCAGMSPAAMDPAQPQLCKAHCEQGTQSVNVTPSAEPSAAFGLIAVLDWRSCATLPASGRPAAGPGDAFALPPPGTPPIYLVLRVLRD